MKTKKKFTYTVVLEMDGGVLRHTSYEGGSQKLAQQFVDAVRSTLVYSSGTATITVRANDALVAVYTVIEGAWTMERHSWNAEVVL